MMIQSFFMKRIMKKKEVSFFNSFSSEAETKTLAEIVEDVRIGSYKDAVEEMRQYRKDENEYWELKKRLPHFTPSGIFDRRRRRSQLAEYNSIIVNRC